MSKQITDGGPVHPTLPEHGFNQGEPGMTLRDYFAAKAIQGICSSGPGKIWTNDMLACEAYRLADAMLKARERQP